MSLEVHDSDSLAHYAKACTDILFRFPFGKQELMGIAARGDFDLRQHSGHSGKLLEYQDPFSSAKFIPHVIEPSIGVDRLFLALLVSAFREEEVNGENRVVLAFHPAIAPVKVAVFPLVSNNPDIVALSQSIAAKCRSSFISQYDVSGGIGKRYRRADEAGIPFCVTIDFDSLIDKSVTVRDRDTMAQQRIPIESLTDFLRSKIQDPF